MVHWSFSVSERGPRIWAGPWWLTAASCWPGPWWLTPASFSTPIASPTTSCTESQAHLWDSPPKLRFGCCSEFGLVRARTRSGSIDSKAHIWRQTSLRFPDGPDAWPARPAEQGHPWKEDGDPPQVRSRYSYSDAGMGLGASNGLLKAKSIGCG